MAITEAALLVRVKKRTRRDELTVIGDGSNSDFTYYMELAVKRLSQDSLSLRGTATGSLASDTETISLPSDAIDGNGAIDSLTLGSATDGRDPEQSFISWEEFRQGAVAGFALRGKTIYVNPKQETDRNYTLDYRKFHGSTVSTLEFEDKYEECLIPLLCHYVYEDLELTDKANDAELDYKRKLAEVVDDDQPPIVRSRQRS
jgi:hypothetical protein